MSNLVSDAFRLEVRENLGGGASRALRRNAMVPGVIYGAGAENVHVSVDPRDITKGLNTTGFYATLFELNVGKKKERVLVRDVQMHPITDQPMHIDFVRMKKGAKTHVNIPVRFENEDKCPGLKKAGKLNIVLHSIEVTCSVDAIPDEFVVDLSKLDLSEAVHTADLEMPEGAEVTHPERDVTVVTIIAPRGAAAKEEDEDSDAAEGNSAEAESASE